MIEYINQLRVRGLAVREAAREGAGLRLRPIMMTMLVATLGLLPAAMSHDIGSDSQRPFAIVIVGGLIVELLVSVILWPTLYVFWGAPLPRDRRCPPLNKALRRRRRACGLTPPSPDRLRSARIKTAFYPCGGNPARMMDARAAQLL